MEAEKKFYIDRTTGEVREEPVYCEAVLRFLYGSKVGRPFGVLIAELALFPRLIGWWFRRPWTKKNILPFITRYGVDATECEHPVESYSSFDAFFVRTVKSRPLAKGAIIPADGRYLFYQSITALDSFNVKDQKFSIPKLVGLDSLPEGYSQGSMAIARLSPFDYHRFHFPCDCIPGPARLINGHYYSVHPAAFIRNLGLLTENKRMVTELTTDAFGTILYIEIGATAVGSINQTYQQGERYQKGDEKGYFSFGGSTVVLLFEKGSIRLSEDVSIHSADQIETYCQMGQSLGNPLT